MFCPAHPPGRRSRPPERRRPPLGWCLLPQVVHVWVPRLPRSGDRAVAHRRRCTHHEVARRHTPPSLPSAHARHASPRWSADAPGRPVDTATVVGYTVQPSDRRCIALRSDEMRHLREDAGRCVVDECDGGAWRTPRCSTVVYPHVDLRGTTVGCAAPRATPPRLLLALALLRLDG